MKSREEVIEIMKSICNKNKDIELGLGEVASASWKEKLVKISDIHWKAIGSISSLSLVFDIKPEELN